MTEVKIDAAHFIDSVEQASRFSEKANAAFSRTTGLFITIDPEKMPGFVLIRSTDGASRFSRFVPADVSGEATWWRLPISELAKIAGGVKADGDPVLMMDGEPMLRLKATGVKAKVPMIQDPDFLVWDIVNPAELSEAPDFMECLRSVEWACSDEAMTSALSGVLVTGTHLAATNRYRLAYAPAALPEGFKPGILPQNTLTRITSDDYDPLISITERELIAQTDSYTQVRITLIEGDFPDITRLVSMMDRPLSVRIDAAGLLDAVRRAHQFTDADQQADFIFGVEELMILSGGGERSIVQTSVPLLEPLSEDSTTTIRLNVAYLLSTLRGAKGEVTIGFENPSSALSVLTSRSQALLMPVKPR